MIRCCIGRRAHGGNGAAGLRDALAPRGHSAQLSTHGVEQVRAQLFATEPTSALRLPMLASHVVPASPRHPMTRRDGGLAPIPVEDADEAEQAAREKNVRTLDKLARLMDRKRGRRDPQHSESTGDRA